MAVVRARFLLPSCTSAVSASVAVGCWLICGSGATAQEVKVVGGSPNNVQMIWTVTNHSTKRINYFEVPIYRVNQVDPAPQGWKVEHFDRLKEGKLVFVSTERMYDIRAGGKAEFSCTIRLSGAPIRARTAIVGFRNGETIEVPDVLVPVPHSLFEVYGLPAFLAGLLVVFVLWKRRASKRARRG